MDEFEKSIFEFWEDCVFTTGADNVDAGGLYALVFKLIDRSGRDDRLKAIQSCIAEQSLSPEGRIRANNFKWFLSEFVLPNIGHPTTRSHSYYSLYHLSNFIADLRRRTGNTLSAWERIALAWNPII